MKQNENKTIKPRDIFSSNFKNSTEVVKFLENIENTLSRIYELELQILEENSLIYLSS